MQKKIIFSALLICVVAALVAVGTWAYFSDVEYSRDNTFAAGSLDLKVDGMDDPDVATYFDIECVAPGDNGSATILLTNAATCPPDCVPANADVHIMNLVDNENGLTEPEVVLGDDETTGELSQYMWITMTAYDASDAVQWYTEGWLDLLNCTNFIMGPLDPGTSITLVITWEVPAGTGNIIQTDTLSFDIEFSLDQRIGTPPDMSLTDITQPASLILCDPATVSVDVTNNGENTGTAVVTLNIDSWTKTKTVTVAGGATVTVDFTTWHATEAGAYAVVASIPDDLGEGPHTLECAGGITVYAPPEYEAEWEAPLPVEVYVCDMLTVAAILHNVGDVSATVDVTLTITVVGIGEKYSETVAGVTLDPCVPVVVVFPAWHVVDPLSMTANLVVDVDGAPVLTGQITIIDLDPVVTIQSPLTCTSITPPGSVTVQARVTDDAGVLGASFWLDAEAPPGVPNMVLVSGDPLDGIYEGTWNTGAYGLGDHTLWVGAVDTVMNGGADAEVVHLEKAVFDISAISVDPNPVVECDTVTISITVTNTGNISGSIHIVVQVDGVTVIDETVTIEPDDSYTATYTFHPEVGSYEVAGMGQPSVTLVVNPAVVIPGPSSTWVSQWTYNGVPDAIATTHLVGDVASIPDMTTCPVVPPAGPAKQADISLSVHPTRIKGGTPITLYGITAYADPSNGQTLYAFIPGDTAGTPLDIEQANEAYTLISGSHIGQPYEVGASWSYDAHNVAWVGGFMCMSEAHAITTVTVVAENQTKVVTAGTFTDCFEIQVSTAAPGLMTQWYSPSAGTIVYQTDDQSWDHLEIWELLSYTIVP